MSFLRTSTKKTASGGKKKKNDLLRGKENDRKLWRAIFPTSWKEMSRSERYEGEKNKHSNKIAFYFCYVVIWSVTGWHAYTEIGLAWMGSVWMWGVPDIHGKDIEKRKRLKSKRKRERDWVRCLTKWFCSIKKNKNPSYQILTNLSHTNTHNLSHLLISFSVNRYAVKVWNYLK